MKANLVQCPICGVPNKDAVKTNPVYSKYGDNEKAVVFDIDNTILDSEQRFIDARRAGLVDNEGKAVVKGMTSKGRAQKKRDDFIYKETQLDKDKVIPGSLELITDLMKKGYVIIYVTSRPLKAAEKTRRQLENKGFPLFRNRNGEVLLYTREGGSLPAAQYKRKVFANLQGNYKIEMVFDDDHSVLNEAKSLKIPGVYSSIKEYSKYEDKSDWKFAGRKHHDASKKKSNPRKEFDESMNVMFDSLENPSAIEGPKGPYVITEDVEAAQEAFEEWADKKDAPENYPNPLPKPKRKKQKNGKYRKEPARRYVTRLMGMPKMNKEFKDAAQRYAVALSLVERYYGKQARLNIAPKANPANPKKVEKGKKLYKHMNKKSPDSVETKQIDIGDVWYQVGEGGCWQIGYMSGKETKNSDQKYVHHFNEETKDGNYPKLYATMPDKGKPMLIITGGTWKIKTDKTGTAWIYD